MHTTKQKIGEVQLFDIAAHGGRQNQRSSSVSWNCTGSWIAWGSRTDRMAKIWTIEGGSPREVVVISGHSGPVDRVRFHPTDPNLLVTTAQDRSIRVWDLRGSTQRLVSRYDLQCPPRFGTCPASVEWDRNGMLIVAERDNTIHLYDSRKGQQRSSKLKSIDLQPHVVDGCQASPSGDYYVATTSARGEGMGELRIWSVNDDDAENAFVYPAHTGPIYQFCFSPDSTRLATGGSDTLVGLWDTETMVCTGTISRRTKFIRSVAFSPDSLLLASSTEEDGIDIADAASGEWLGTIPLMTNRPRGTGGADEVCFYPKRPYLLACARGSDFPMGVNPPPVTIAKWNMVQA